SDPQPSLSRSPSPSPLPIMSSLNHLLSSTAIDLTPPVVFKLTHPFSHRCRFIARIIILSISQSKFELV
ncbi:hypothetical protein PanWU01x14_197000, partial [Parasponia andersonii]